MNYKIQKLATEHGKLIHTEQKIIVLVDEGHRTQYKLQAEAMRSAIPNGVFFAFTGTPIDKKDRSTYQVFGPLLDRYTFEESKADGATLPIFYEARMADLYVEGEQVVGGVKEVTNNIQVGAHYVVMSGYAEITPFPAAAINDIPMQGQYEERLWEANVVIGPVWREIMQVSPVVAPGNFFDYDNDDNDSQGWQLDTGCSWEEVEVGGKKRIRLKFVMKQQGETSRFM